MRAVQPSSDSVLALYKGAVDELLGRSSRGQVNCVDETPPRSTRTLIFGGPGHPRNRATNSCLASGGAASVHVRRVLSRELYRTRYVVSQYFSDDRADRVRVPVLNLQYAMLVAVRTRQHLVECGVNK